MKFRPAFAALLMTVAVAACGNLPFQKEEAAAPAAPAHSGPPAVSPLDQPIETGGENVPVATAEASTMATAMFRATGAGWTVTAADKNAVYERSGAKSVGVTVRRMSYGKGVEFVGNMNGSVFALNIRAAACEAGGQKTPFTANLRVGSQRLTGCAVATDTMPKAQTRSSSASPKPKAAPKATAPAKPKPAETEAVPAATTPATTPAATPAPEASTPATTTAPATTAPATTVPATTAPATTTPSVTTPAPATTPAPVEAPKAETPAEAPKAEAPKAETAPSTPAVIVPAPAAPATQ